MYSLKGWVGSRLPFSCCLCPLVPWEMEAVGKNLCHHAKTGLNKRKRKSYWEGKRDVINVFCRMQSTKKKLWVGISEYIWSKTIHLQTWSQNCNVRKKISIWNHAGSVLRALWISNWASQWKHISFSLKWGSTGVFSKVNKLPQRKREKKPVKNKVSQEHPWQNKPCVYVHSLPLAPARNLSCNLKPAAQGLREMSGISLVKRCSKQMIRWCLTSSQGQGSLAWL